MLCFFGRFALNRIFGRFALRDNRIVGTEASESADSSDLSESVSWKLEVSTLVHLSISAFDSGSTTIRSGFT